MLSFFMLWEGICDATVVSSSVNLPRRFFRVSSNSFFHVYSAFPLCYFLFHISKFPNFFCFFCIRLVIYLSALPTNLTAGFSNGLFCLNCLKLSLYFLSFLSFANIF